MRNQIARALKPRSLEASALADWDQAHFYLCHDGSGDTLSDSVGGADAATYTGTGSTLWDSSTIAYGVQPDGDGSWPLPKEVNAAFNWDTPMVFGASFEISAGVLTETGQGVILAAGSNATAGANEPAAGHWQLRMQGITGSDYQTTLDYRDGADDDSAGLSNQSVGFGASGEKIDVVREIVNFQILVQYNGSTLSWTYYKNGIQIDSANFTLDGTQRLNLTRTREAALDGVVRIGAHVNGLDPSVTERPTWQLNSNGTEAVCIQSLCFFRSETKTALEASAILTQLNNYRGRLPI